MSRVIIVGVAGILLAAGAALARCGLRTPRNCALKTDAGQTEA